MKKSLVAAGLALGILAAAVTQLLKQTQRSLCMIQLNVTRSLA